MQTIILSNVNDEDEEQVTVPALNRMSSSRSMTQYSARSKAIGEMNIMITREYYGIFNLLYQLKLSYP